MTDGWISGLIERRVDGQAGLDVGSGIDVHLYIYTDGFTDTAIYNKYIHT